MNQVKIFRKIKNSKSIFKATEYRESDCYADVIKSEKELGYRQVIINSSLMLKIIADFSLNENFVLLEVTFNQSVDKEYTDEIKKYINDIKVNRALTNELILKLSWASEKDSIDIEKISFGYKEIDRDKNSFKMITIISNGVLSGNDTLSFYSKYLLNTLEGYY